jgi:hypothetical protein
MLVFRQHGSMMLIGQLLDQSNLKSFSSSQVALSNAEKRRSLSCSYQKLFQKMMVGIFKRIAQYMLS